MRNQTDTFTGNPADRLAELDELDFNDDEPQRNWGDTEGDTLTADDLDATEPSGLDQDPTDDDLTPDTLIPDDGARSPFEHDSGDKTPADETFSIVKEDEIGAGHGLDEAEMAQVDPLDGGNTKQ